MKRKVYIGKYKSQPPPGIDLVDPLSGTIKPGQAFMFYEHGKECDDPMFVAYIYNAINLNITICENEITDKMEIGEIEL